MAISPRAPRDAPFSNPAATLSLPLAGTTRRRHSQTDNEQGPSPIIESIRGPHAGGEHNGRRRPATTCSGSTSAPGAADRIRRRRSFSASARHAVVSATTRSPCRLHGLLRESAGGPGESRHVRPHRQRARRRAPAGPCCRRRTRERHGSRSSGWTAPIGARLSPQQAPPGPVRGRGRPPCRRPGPSARTLELVASAGRGSRSASGPTIRRARSRPPLLGYPDAGSSHVMIHPKMTPSGIVDELGRFAADVGTLVSRVG